MPYFRQSVVKRALLQKLNIESKNLSVVTKKNISKGYYSIKDDIGQYHIVIKSIEGKIIVAGQLHMSLYVDSDVNRRNYPELLDNITGNYVMFVLDELIGGQTILINEIERLQLKYKLKTALKQKRPKC